MRTHVKHGRNFGALELPGSQELRFLGAESDLLVIPLATEEEGFLALIVAPMLLIPGLSDFLLRFISRLGPFIHNHAAWARSIAEKAGSKLLSCHGQAERLTHQPYRR